jgi:cytochrome c-type biogenesis protein CcmH/NrfG
VLAGLSAVHRQRAFLNLTSNRDDEIRRAVDLAQHSLSLDPNEPQANWAVGRAHMLQNEVASALQAFERATRLNPSFAMSHYSVGFARSMIGASGPSSDALRRALRLSPVDPMRFAMLATDAFNAAFDAEYERAADLATLAAGQPNAHHHIVAVAALCNALAQRRSTAERYLKQLRALSPAYTLAYYLRAFPFQSEAHVALWRKGFETLGIPG